MRVLLKLLVLLSPLVLMAALSSRPAYHFNASDEAEIVISIKRLTNRIKLCDEEEQKEFDRRVLKRRPHMRRAEAICGERERAPINVSLMLDNMTLIKTVVAPSGLRDDGPVYYFGKFALKPGRHELTLAMSDISDNKEINNVTLVSTIEVQKGRVVIIEYDSDAHRFFIVGR